MFGRQILNAAGIVGPVGHPGSREIQAGGYLPLERVPGGIDVRGPENCSVPLRARVGVPREDQRAPLRLVLAKAVVKRRRVKERIDVVELRTRTNLEIRAVGRYVGFGLVGPE